LCRRWRRAALAFARRLRSLPAGLRVAALPTGPSLTGATEWASRRIIMAIPTSSATAATSASTRSVLLELEDSEEAELDVTVRTGTEVVGLVAAGAVTFGVLFAVP
jgi:hypothetical protein